MNWSNQWTDDVVVVVGNPSKRDISVQIEKEIKDRKVKRNYGDMPIVYVEIAFVDPRGSIIIARKRTRDGILSPDLIKEMAIAINKDRCCTLRLEDFHVTYNDGLRN